MRRSRLIARRRPVGRRASPTKAATANRLSSSTTLYCRHGNSQNGGICRPTEPHFIPAGVNFSHSPDPAEFLQNGIIGTVRVFRALDFTLLGYDRLRVPYLISRRSLGKLLVAAPLARAFAGERNMFLSLNSVLLQGRVRWPDFARLAAQMGFPGTDIMLRPAMQAGVAQQTTYLPALRSGQPSSIFRSNSGKTTQPSMPRSPSSTQPPSSLPLSTARA